MKKEYIIQTTIYNSGLLIESTTVSYPIKFENKHKLVEVIHRMIKSENERIAEMEHLLDHHAGRGK